MRILTDFEGNEIELPDSAVAHIRHRHPRIFRIPDAIELTLNEPDRIEPSLREPGVLVYVKEFERFDIGDWRVRVIVKFEPERIFIKTATVNKLTQRRHRR